MRFNLYIKKEAGWASSSTSSRKASSSSSEATTTFWRASSAAPRSPTQDQDAPRPLPWAKQFVTLATEPLVKKLTPKEIKEVEKAHKVSWKKWFGGAGGA